MADVFVFRRAQLGNGEEMEDGKHMAARQEFRF